MSVNLQDSVSMQSIQNASYQMTVASFLLCIKPSQAKPSQAKQTEPYLRQFLSNHLGVAEIAEDALDDGDEDDTDDTDDTTDSRDYSNLNEWATLLVEARWHHYCVRRATSRHPF
jgi:hypothetical protein